MNPFLHRVPENEREEYFDETIETVLDQFKSNTHYEFYDANRIRMSYKSIIAYGKK